MAAGDDGKIDYKQLQEDAKDAYSEYSKDGSFTDKAKNIYSEIQKNHSGSDDKKEKKEDKD